MLNIHDLERRWIKYTVKRYLPFVLSTIGILAIIIFSLLYLPKLGTQTENLATSQKAPLQQTTISDTSRAQSSQNDPTNISIDVPKNTQVEAITTKQNSLILKPSLHFMDNIENGLSSYVQEEYVAPQVQRNEFNNGPQYNENSFSPNEIIPEVTEVQKDEKKLSLSITTEKNDSDLKDVIRRFKKNKNPALSLFIAKHYYDTGDYQKSYNYALMTNEIDKSIDASWIIFSKSLVKLGQQELAMNTLKSYLKTSKSSAAEVLLRKIESGNFK